MRFDSPAAIEMELQIIAIVNAAVILCVLMILIPPNQMWFFSFATGVCAMHSR